ncbi:hypothetical protein [Paenibacillus herberti]|uniref:Uncharacterized protein n=1 Tax=Paenibacillus herberti TaxID=1619309 RepID=A0A229NUD9_9BACL|nr:hypothetical protein [Paenibacillus herberti]OXM13503.1 hypothetical protein CGZ75_20910 [Paenibacillus herberti]
MSPMFFILIFVAVILLLVAAANWLLFRLLHLHDLKREPSDGENSRLPGFARTLLIISPSFIAILLFLLLGFAVLWHFLFQFILATDDNPAKPKDIKFSVSQQKAKYEIRFQWIRQWDSDNSGQDHILFYLPYGTKPLEAQPQPLQENSVTSYLRSSISSYLKSSPDAPEGAPAYMIPVNARQPETVSFSFPPGTDVQKVRLYYAHGNEMDTGHKLWFKEIPLPLDD